MGRQDKRFVKIHSQSGFATTFQIWVDTETGVNYIYASQGYSGGLTPLLDREGRPVISAVGSFSPSNPYR